MDVDGFQVVKAKKGRSRQHLAQTSHLKLTPSLSCSEESEDPIDVESFVSQIELSLTEFRASVFFGSFLETLTEHCSPERKISRFVCLGIGRFGSDRCSRHQLVFLVCLTRHLQLSGDQVAVFDPKLSEGEKDILRRLNLTVECRNEEGKYPVDSGSIFYFPHCPKHLTNNLLWANWNKSSLAHLVLISNSFERIVTNLPERLLKEEGLDFVLRAREVVRETPVKNCFSVGDVFNDTAVHSFPESALSELNCEKFWDRGGEPIYLEPDLEFVRK